MATSDCQLSTVNCELAAPCASATLPAVRHVAFAAGLLLVAATAARGQEVVHPRVQEARTLLEMWLEGQAAYEQIPAVSGAVVHDQIVVWAGAFGDADPARGIRATATTPYAICSLSKLFTAVAVMQLRDEGRLRLDDPVTKHLPWFALRQAAPDSAPVTVESLLTHSAGLPQDPSIPYWTGAFDFPTREQVIASLPTEEALYPAQRRYGYSNLGFFLAG